jgi:hypothetical protein
MKGTYSLAWLLILAAALAGAAWVEYGKAYVRRRDHGVPPIAESTRTESRFLAVLLPRITAERGKYAMSTAELAEFLDGLKAAGFVSIGLDDVADFYARGRRLPPKAVLLAFAEDDPQGLELADDALKGLRLRGAAFISRTASAEDGDRRRFLTGHAVGQMRRGGAWEFGSISALAPPPLPQAGEVLAVLDDDGRRPAPRRPYPLRFVASELGLDDGSDDPRALSVLALRPERSPAENLLVVQGAWPRTAEFADDFSAGRLGADWIAGWGIVSLGPRRLALLPTPHQSGAGVFLRGTERWRDVAVEFELKKYQKEFWAYARYKDEGRFLRVGARGGFWYVEQKTGAQSLPSLLARSPILENGLPARVRLVVKDGTAIVHVNGRMQFGRPLRVNPAVDRGRILFGVYDAKSRSALAVLTSVRAAPLGGEWIAPRHGVARGFDEERLAGLREEAALASALSPRWIEVASDGGVSVVETQGVLVRSLADFYGCRLVPMAEFPAFGASVFASPASAAAALAGFIEAARGLDAAGLNLRLSGGEAARPETVAFLSKLRAALRARREELWVTVDDARAPDAALKEAVDGVLRPAQKRRSDLEILESSPGTTAAPEPKTSVKTRPQTLRQTASRTQREPASIQ